MTLPPFFRSVRHRLSSWASVRADLADAGVRDCVRLVLDSPETGVRRARFLARGGTALIFRATRRAGADAALKVPRYRLQEPGGSSGIELAVRREGEVLEAVRLTVVPLLLWRSPTGHCFLRELIEGTCLETLIKDRRLSLRQRGELLRALIETSRALFAVVHDSPQGRFVIRDFKPRNFIRAIRDGRLVLVDLGALRREGSDSATKDSVDRLGSGKWRYWSPEQLLGHNAVDRRTDYFALAATALTVLTGDAPYTNLNPNKNEALRVYREEHRRAVAQLKASAPAVGLSRSLADFISSALHPDVEARPCTFGIDLSF